MAPMFGITYVIGGHEVRPKTRLAAKVLPETIELRDSRRPSGLFFKAAIPGLFSWQPQNPEPRLGRQCCQQDKGW